MASACVVPWTVERDEPPPNSPPIFDEDGTSPPLTRKVPATVATLFQPTVAAIDADLGDILTARLFVELATDENYFFGQEFRLVLQSLPNQENAQRRTGMPLTAFNYCTAFGSTTLRVVVTDGIFSNQPGQQHKVTSGHAILSSWSLECN